MGSATISTPLAEPLPEPTLEKRLEVITVDQATSKCIGRPITPLCAVETLIVCHIRGVTTPCPVIVRTNPRPDWQIQDDRPQDVKKYRVQSIERLSQRTIPLEKRNPKDPYAWRLGDVRITLEIYDCEDHADHDNYDVYNASCETNKFARPRVAYAIVRAVDRQWLVLE